VRHFIAAGEHSHHASFEKVFLALAGMRGGNNWLELGLRGRKQTQTKPIRFLLVSVTQVEKLGLFARYGDALFRFESKENIARTPTPFRTGFPGSETTLACGLSQVYSVFRDRPGECPQQAAPEVYDGS
jgi:hypothetical protein